MTPPLNRYIIHAISEGEHHTATWDYPTKGGAVRGFLENARMLFTDTVIHSVEELGPVDELDA